MEKQEIVKLREHLRRTFGSPAIQVAPSSRNDDAAEVKLGELELGVITADEEDGDRSFFFEMAIPVERPALQDYLRKLFQNDRLTIAARGRKTDSVELNLGSDHIGVITADDAKGKTFTLEMAILDIDLDDL
ncbi:MAG: DUF3126 family protein [Roseiarcus sp.]